MLASGADRAASARRALCHVRSRRCVAGAPSRAGLRGAPGGARRGPGCVRAWAKSRHVGYRWLGSLASALASTASRCARSGRRSDMRGGGVDQMVADDDGAIRVLKRWRAGQQVKGRGSQRILIRAAVERLAQELLGGHVVDRSHRDVVVGEVADVVDPASDAEVGRRHPPPMAIGRGHEDVLRLDVAMEQTTLMTEVERIGHRRHDLHDVLFRHAAAVVLSNQSARVSAVDVVHRDPEPCRRTHRDRGRRRYVGAAVSRPVRPRE